jgi:hypothetical protein
MRDPPTEEQSSGERIPQPTRPSRLIPARVIESGHCDGGSGEFITLDSVCCLKADLSAPCHGECGLQTALWVDLSSVNSLCSITTTSPFFLLPPTIDLFMRYSTMSYLIEYAKLLTFHFRWDSRAPHVDPGFLLYDWCNMIS